MTECTGDCDKKCSSHEDTILGLASLKSKVLTAGAILSLFVGSLLASIGFLGVSSQSFANEVDEEFKKVRIEASANRSHISLINQNMSNLSKALLYNRKLLIAIAKKNDIDAPIETSLLVLEEEDE